MHRTLIRTLEALGRDRGWLREGAALPDEGEIASLLKSASIARKAPHPLDAHRELIKRWVEAKLSYVVMHRSLAERGVGVSEATVRRYVKARLLEAAPRAVTPRNHEPGAVMDIDFGYLGLVWDAGEGRRRKAWFFSGRLRYSRKAFREIVFEQTSERFFECHIHAFEHFGGVPAAIVPDNLKAAVIEASIEDPMVNKGYQLLAEHYGFVINPCLPYHPRHKGGVESDVKYVKENFWKGFMARQRELGIELPDAREAQAALERWGAEVADARVIGGVGATVDELFAEEKPRLKPLPLCRWGITRWRRLKVHETFRVQYRKAYYTVPYRYIGKEVDLMDTGNRITIFFEGKEIAMHDKATREWSTMESPAHMPPEALAYLDATKERVAALAKSVGPSVLRVTELILARRAVDGLRPARALLALRKTYGEEALDQACSLALLYDCCEYRAIKGFLAKKDEASFPPRQERFAFAREPGFFADRPARSAGGAR